MAYNAEISLDLVLVLRLLVAFGFGIFYALFLHFSRQGQYLAKQLTWAAVVIGIGADLTIAYNADWWTVAGVVALSSVGIIGRSLVSASREERDVELGRYKTKWVLDDVDDYSSDLIALLDELLKGSEQRDNGKVGKALRLAYRISSVVNDALAGRYEQRRLK
jgi:hypothetical protein